MNDYGFVRVASAVPRVKVAQPNDNVQSALELIKEAYAKDVQLIGFPELAVTGYSCADLLLNNHLINRAEQALQKLLDETADLDIIIILGMPVRLASSLLDGAVVLHKGRIIASTAKTFLCEESGERHWFADSSDIQDGMVEICGQSVLFAHNLIVGDKKMAFSVEIGEDLFAAVAPSSIQSVGGSLITFNLSAFKNHVGTEQLLEDTIRMQSARCISGYVLSSAGEGESSGDHLYKGKSVIASNGSFVETETIVTEFGSLSVSDIDVDALKIQRTRNSIFKELKGNGVLYQAEIPEWRADRLICNISESPFVNISAEESCKQAFNIQVSSLCVRMQNIGAKRAVIGVSGGLDSTLALLVMVAAFDRLGIDRNNIIAVTMPGFGTTDRTYQNAVNLMAKLGVSTKEISIKEACKQHFADIDHDPAVRNVVYENSQARERTQILMDLANKENALVIGTGDLSELALGWCTYNGDHMSMYAVNAGVPKTMVRLIVLYAANNIFPQDIKPYLVDVVETPVSPELLPADNKGNIDQKTEEIVGPYELHDFFLYHFVKSGFEPKKIEYLAEKAFEGKYDRDTINKWLKIFLRRFFGQQFKRSCMPDGPQIYQVSLSPRGGWLFPSDVNSLEWIDEL